MSWCAFKSALHFTSLIMKNPWKCSPLIYGSAKHQNLQILRFLTFFKCLFTHFVKVFFCMASRSSGEKGISWRRRRRRRIGRRKMGGRWKPRKLLTDVNAARPLNHSGSRHFQTDPASFKREAAHSQPWRSQDRNSLKSKVQYVCIPGIGHTRNRFQLQLIFRYSAWGEETTVEGHGTTFWQRAAQVMVDQPKLSRYSCCSGYRIHIYYICLTDSGLVGCTWGYS